MPCSSRMIAVGALLAATFEGSGVATGRSDGGLEVTVSDGAERGFKLQFQQRDRP